MKLLELKAGQGKVDVEVTVKSKAEPRVMNKYGKELKVANAVVQDESGEMKLSLWNDDVDKVNAGDKIKITNGYVSEFNGEKQLTSGKFGKLEVVGASSPSVSDSAEDDSSFKKPKKEKADKKTKKEEEKEKAEDEEFEADAF
ncbi:MAG: OB-fold nucleic acid binding domain-containing protein [Nanoarchaeota archaeon]